MTQPFFQPHNPELDLVLTRVLDVPAERVWAAWTQPALLMPWFCPLPWKTIECEIDLRPGGQFRTVMQSPEGATFPNTGCYLDIVPGRRLVWTGALGPGFRPVDPTPGMPTITAIIEIEPAGEGGRSTRYTATCLHSSPAATKQHADMGFEGGWGTALDQMVAGIKSAMAGA
jgi:uncharacterized protein YndB with AHSA1/START domain